MKEKNLQKLEEQLSILKEMGNNLYKEQHQWYGQLRGFKKHISVLLQDELDGGKTRELNAIETNNYKIAR